LSPLRNLKIKKKSDSQNSRKSVLNILVCKKKFANSTICSFVNQYATRSYEISLPFLFSDLHMYFSVSSLCLIFALELSDFLYLIYMVAVNNSTSVVKAFVHL